MKTIRFNGHEHKVFGLSTEFGNFEIILTEERYSFDDSLAVEAYEVEGDQVTDLFATLTVCLPGGSFRRPKPGPGEPAFLDTNNNGYAERFLRENKLAKKTGVARSSGYCTYPLYEWDTAAFYADGEKEK